MLCKHNSQWTIIVTIIYSRNKWNRTIVTCLRIPVAGCNSQRPSNKLFKYTHAVLMLISFTIHFYGVSFFWNANIIRLIHDWWLISKNFYNVFIFSLNIGLSFYWWLLHRFVKVQENFLPRFSRKRYSMIESQSQKPHKNQLI